MIPALARPRWIEDAGGVLALALGAVVAPYFVLRGWLNAGGTLLGLVAVWRVTAAGGWRALGAHRPLALAVAALCAPLALTALAQALHGEFAPRHLDPPLRVALGGALLVYLHQRRVDWLRAAGVAVPLSLLLCAALLLAPGAARFHWGDRVASYFMDPLMLAQHAALVGFLSLFLVRADDTAALRALKLAGWLAGLGIALATGSRTGWLMLPLLALLWLASTGRLRRPLHLALALGALALAALALYALSPVVRTRVDLVATEIPAYLAGANPDTSIGIRLSLFQVAWAAFLEHPWAGWGFTTLPTPEALPATAALWTDLMRATFIHSGTHNEWLQHMMRMGVLGLLARAALYLVPLALFARAALAGEGPARTAGYLGLVVVGGYLTASFTSEVSNLVYLSTFYGTMVAAFGAIALQPRQP
ncbi:O-antigen ligase family protein [Ramlibacter sp. MAHUQ-53]|uniref:O-antigen ligase family protein n=1 Tax=unclassified Ramlibacter TaxID=2617605 RepID=UPI00362F198D